MSSSTAATALLILTIFIASEVSSAPREERIQQDSRQEKFVETREAEVLERHSIGNEKYGLSREDEVRHRPARLVKEPEPPKNETETASTKKPTSVETKNETLEAKDMNESVAPPEGDDDSTDSNKTLPKSTDNNNNDKKTSAVEVSENKSSTDNATIVKDASLPPKYFPEDGVRKTNETVIHTFLEHEKIDGAPPDIATNKTSDTKPVVNDGEKTSETSSSPISSKVPPTDAGTATEASTTTTMTSKPQSSSVQTTIITSSTNTISTPTTIVTTEYSPKSEVITESTMMVFSTEPSKAELQLHARKVAPMPSGVVALITAIAFAIVAVMAYVGLVAWRRYLEWRYGNRELLVNDFDANDIGNFEL